MAMKHTYIRQRKLVGPSVSCLLCKDRSLFSLLLHGRAEHTHTHTHTHIVYIYVHCIHTHVYSFTGIYIYKYNTQEADDLSDRSSSTYVM